MSVLTPQLLSRPRLISFLYQSDSKFFFTVFFGCFSKNGMWGVLLISQSLQTEQMSRIVNELDSIQFSIKKASKLVKEVGRQVSSYDY